MSLLPISKLEWKTRTSFSSQQKESTTCKSSKVQHAILTVVVVIATTTTTTTSVRVWMVPSEKRDERGEWNIQFHFKSAVFSSASADEGKEEKKNPSLSLSNDSQRRRPFLFIFYLPYSATPREGGRHYCVSATGHQNRLCVSLFYFVFIAPALNLDFVRRRRRRQQQLI